MPRQRTTVAVGVALLVAVSLPDAHAKTSLQGTATVAGGWTDNANLTPIPTPDFFMNVRPGLRLTSAFTRGMLYAGYTFDATLYLHVANATGYSNQVNLGGMVETSRSTTLRLEASFMQSSLNNVLIQQPTGAAAPVLLPGTVTNFLTARLDEGFSWEIDPHWRLDEGSTFTAFYPLTAGLGDAYDLNNIVDLSRSWMRDSGILDLRVDYINYGGGTGPLGTSASTSQLIQSLTARWVHDFGRYVSSDLGLGVLLAMRADDGGGRLIQPTARAALHYRREEGSVDLTYVHDVTANPLASQTFLTDSVLLGGALPLGRTTHLVLVATGGYSHGLLYDQAAGALTGSYDLWSADATLAYAPWRELDFFARYQFIDQLGNPHDPTPIPGYMRSVVMIGATVLYPAQSAAPFGFRPSTRVDRSDEIRPPAAHSEDVPR